MTKATAEHSRFAEDYHFAASHPGVLGDRQAAITNRDDMQRRLTECCAQREDLHRSLLEHPRAVYAVAVEESFGIHRSLFFVQIRQVEVIEEDELTLGVVLTACHLGCVAPRLPIEGELTHSQCHICRHGNGQFDLSSPSQRTEALNRDELRCWIQDRAKADAAFREELISSPSMAWTRVVEEVEIPANDSLRMIQTLRVFVETEETIGFILDFDQMNPSPVAPFGITSSAAPTSR